ncbi:MAG: Hpt domain-containing protein [Leptospiraceae bacterium]|nr:Hpt domain-containing protein [Leptospiraceae bacterium]
MIDLSYFIQISGNKPSFLLRVMNIFIEETPNDLEDLELNFRESNYQKVKEISHKLKGLFQSYKLSELVDYTLRLESDAKQGKFSEESEIVLNEIIKLYSLIRLEMIKLTEEYKS